MTSPTDDSFIQREANQFALLNQRRFGPFFWTQFCGAANDNLFKFAFTVMVTYQLSVSWLPVSLAGLVIGALFILPYVLFSATSGQLAEKYAHPVIMRWVKNCEIGIMALAAVGFMTHDVIILLMCTFLMGLHSTVFGPVKYSYLPRVLGEHELTGGNGMTEMGTFVAILLGNVAGGLLVAMPEIGHASVAVACVGVAVLGRWMSGHIPPLTATHPEQTMNWNPITETLHNLQLARTNAKVFQTLLGISWMWFFGAVFLSQFPSFAKEVLHGGEQVAADIARDVVHAQLLLHQGHGREDRPLWAADAKARRARRHHAGAARHRQRATAVARRAGAAGRRHPRPCRQRAGACPGWRCHGGAWRAP